MEMIDMANDADDMPTPQVAGYSPPRYPYGLCICLGNDELDKLGLDSDCEVGDMLHLMAMAKVTSISKRETDKGDDCRIEMQITHLGLEDESQEQIPMRRIRPEKFYE